MKRCGLYFKTNCKYEKDECCHDISNEDICPYMTEKDICKRCDNVNALDCSMCTKTKDEEYIELYEELRQVALEISDYYNVGRVGSRSVYIYDKIYDSNVFDILSNDICMYSGEHIVIEEAKAIIEKIQNKLIEIESFIAYYEHLRIKKEKETSNITFNISQGGIV